MASSFSKKYNFTRTTESHDDDPNKVEISQIKFRNSTITKFQTNIHSFSLRLFSDESITMNGQKAPGPVLSSFR